MMANEQMGFEDLVYIGQDTGTGSYISVIVADRSSGLLIPGAAVAVSYNGNTYGANTTSEGKALVLTGAPPNTPLNVTVTYPGYAPTVVSLATVSDANTPPTGVVMDKGAAPVAMATPGAKPMVGPGGKALVSAPAIPTWWIYVGLGAIGIVGLIVIVAMNKRAAA